MSSPDALPISIDRPRAGLAARWREFWFAPASAEPLGWCRLIVFAAVLLSRLPARAHDWAHIPVMFYHPVGLFNWFQLPLPKFKVIRAMEISFWVVLALSAAGCWTRITTVIALILGAYLLGLPNNFGKVGHGEQMTALILLILACSRSGDAISVDRWFETRRGKPRPPPSTDYRWPIRMVWVLMSAVFFAAGVSKLRRGGFDWITTDSFKTILLQAHYSINRPPTDWGLWLAKHALLCRMIAAGSVALELGFPIALFVRRLRGPIVIAAMLMQLGIGLTMGIWFIPYLYGYLFWLPWERIVSKSAGSRVTLPA